MPTMEHAAKPATKTNQQLVGLLQKAYTMELETVCNYLAHSVDLDGVRAEEIKKSLADDVTEELGHARLLANRLKQIGGRVPTSMGLDFDQSALQANGDTTDVRSVIEGVLEAEHAAIDHYRAIFEATDGNDPVTQDLAVRILADEEAHRTQFEGFLAEYSNQNGC